MSTYFYDVSNTPASHVESPRMPDLVFNCAHEGPLTPARLARLAVFCTRPLNLPYAAKYVPSEPWASWHVYMHSGRVLWA